MGALAFISIAASVYGGFQAKKAANDQAFQLQAKAFRDREFADFNKEQLRNTARQKADLIMFKAKVLRSTQKVQQSASGVVIGEGSAGQAIADTADLASRDAIVTLFSSINQEAGISQAERDNFQALNNRAGAARQQGDAALLSGITSAIGSFSTFKSLNKKAGK